MSQVSNCPPIGFLSPGWPLAEAPNGIVSYVAAIRDGLSFHGVSSAVLVGREARPGEENVIGVPYKWSIKDRVVRNLRRKVGLLDDPQLPFVRELKTQLEASTRRGLRIFEMEESFGAIERVAVPGLARVVRLHGPWFLNGLALGAENNDAFARRVRNEGFAIERAAAVTAPSRDVLEKVREFYGIELPNARVIPNPGPRVASTDCWQQSVADPKQILFVGRFDRHKGGDLMLRAFAKLATVDPDVRLVFAGPDRGLNEEGKRVDLSTYIEHNVPLEVRGRLICLGAVAPEALVKLRKASAMCIAPSRYENFPMAIVEAFAYGCPIVGSATGGIKELIIHEQNGLLFEPENVDDLAAQITRFLRDPGLAVALARSGRATYEQRLEPTSVAEETLSVYRSLPNCESLGDAARLSA